MLCVPQKLVSSIEVRADPTEAQRRRQFRTDMDKHYIGIILGGGGVPRHKGLRIPRLLPGAECCER